MTDAKLDYWQESIAIAAEECGLTMTTEQLDYLAGAMEGCHENYGQAFYSPPASDRLSSIEDEWRAKYKELQREFEAYQENAKAAVKRVGRLPHHASISINDHGEVIRHD